jgi:hypothetical protein
MDAHNCKFSRCYVTYKTDPIPKVRKLGRIEIPTSDSPGKSQYVAVSASQKVGSLEKIEAEFECIAVEQIQFVWLPSTLLS